MSIIHISFDYPDKWNELKTSAIRNLILSHDLNDNIVFSLNRTVFLNRLTTEKETHGYTLGIFGLPAGILLGLWMFIAYKRILKIIITDHMNASLIHAHKLTFEGIIAYFLARKLKIPYILTIRGDSDLRILYYKNLYRIFYLRIVQRAGKAIVLAPWALKQIKKYFGRKVLPEKFVIIPNIVNVNILLKPGKIKSNKFITAFHFKDFRRKNIRRIIKAFDLIFASYPGYSLDIAGDGPARNRILACIQRARHRDHFFLLGKIEHSQLLRIYPEYQGFVLPSFPETFGLVFLEALVAGIPVVYSHNAGIDGYFDEFQVGIAVDHLSVGQIKSAIEQLILKNSEFTRNVEKMTSTGFLNNFSKDKVGHAYSEIIKQYSL